MNGTVCFALIKYGVCGTRVPRVSKGYPSRAHAIHNQEIDTRAA
jgi:hypothetical protein